MEMRKIGINADARRIDGNFKTLVHDLEYFSKIGFTCVEIPIHGMEVIRNAQILPHRMKELKSILSGFDFIYSVHAPNPLNLMSMDDSETHVKLFNTCLEFTSEINSEIFVYHAGRYIPEERFLSQYDIQVTQDAKEKILNNELEHLSNIAESLKNSKITICIENARPYLDCKDYCYAENINQLSEIVRLLNSENIAINLDVGHAFLASKFYEIPLLESIRKAAPYVKHMHVHDNYGKLCYYYEKTQVDLVPLGKGDMHMPIGWGAVPFKEILSELKGYPGIFLNELRPRYMDYFGDVYNTMQSL
jgi:sugar phosphate isomerase/epimerase